MPTIYIPPKKVYKRVKESNKRDNKNHKAVYNTKRWRVLRIEKLKNDPLCEICLEKDIITSAIDVHHTIPLSHGKTIKEKQILGFDYNNLKSVCKQCHKDIHDDNHRSKDLFNNKPERRSTGFDFV